ncbi:12998_t:CDS:2, partial [Racocetra persica]
NVNTAIYNQMFDPLDHVKRQNDMISSPSTTTSIMDLNRQQHQIDQSAVVNPLTAHAVVQAVASAQQVLIQNIISSRFAAAAVAKVQQVAQVQQQQQPPQNLPNDQNSSVVLVIENPGTNNQTTTTNTVQSVVSNDPMNLVESIANAQMVESMNLVEQNRRLAMEIASNNQLAANVNASANIVSQS